MTLTTSDRDNIISMLRLSRTPPIIDDVRARLRELLAGAEIVEPAAVPSTVVTMNSIVSLIDVASGEIARWALVYPGDANVDRLKISVLTPLGAALLGRREGEIIEYTVPTGTKRLFLQKVVEQPESRHRLRATPTAAA